MEMLHSTLEYTR